MCIRERPSEGTVVMSRDDSSTTGSSAPPYTDPEPPYTTSKPHSPPTTTTDQNAKNEHTTASSTNIVPPAGVEIMVQDEQASREENEKSQFAITLVQEHDDLDNSLAHTRLPASMDDSTTLQATVTSRGDSSEDDCISLSEDTKVTAESNSSQVTEQQQPLSTTQANDSSNDVPLPVTTSTPSDSTIASSSSTQSTSTLVPMVSVSSVALASTESLSSVDELTGRTASSLAATSLSSIGGAASGNGPSVLPGASRFRKINNYVRGRWCIRDTTAPEEHRTDGGTCDSKLPGGGGGRNYNAQDIPITGSASPIMGYRRLPNEPSDAAALHTRSTNDLGTIGVGVVGGVGLGLGMITSSPCVVATSDSDRDSHQSSTAADTLSRNTSLSSIPPMEKSIDGDDHLRDLDTESVASAPGSVPSREMPEVTQYPNTTSTLSNPSTPSLSQQVSSSGPPQSGTTSQQATPGHGPSCVCEVCTSGDMAKHTDKEPQRIRSVRTAMSQLQSQLDELLPELATSSKEENKQLHEENIMLRKQNSLLEEEVARLALDVKTLKAALELASVAFPPGLSDSSTELQSTQSDSTHGL